MSKFAQRWRYRSAACTNPAKAARTSSGVNTAAANSSRRGLVGAAQVDPVGIDAGQPPAGAGTAEQITCTQRDRLGMILVDPGQQRRLGRGERARVGRGPQSCGLDPLDPAEPGDQMSALDRDPIEPEIGEAGIRRGSMDDAR